MFFRIAAAVTLGLWLGITAAAWWLPGANFRLLRPENLRHAELVFAKLPAEERGPALRYAASELNRLVFATYATAQGALAGAAVAFVVLAASRGARVGKLGGALLTLAVIVVALELIVTPAIVELGRLIDFMPRDPPPPEVQQFGKLHAVYVVADLVKAVALAGTTLTLVRSAQPPMSSRASA